MITKTNEYWVLMVVLAIYLFMRAKTLPWYSRLLNSAIAMGLGLGLSDAVAPITFGDERWAVAAIMLLGTAVLDIVATIFSDREFWRAEGKEIIRDWLRKRLGVRDAD